MFNNRMLFGILTMAMSTVGTVLIAKDDNTTGPDDVCGNMLLAGASAFDGVQTGNQSKFDNAMVRGVS